MINLDVKKLMNRTRILIGLSIIVLSTQCQWNTKKYNEPDVSSTSRSDSKFILLRNEFENPTGHQILVAAHRGDWRNAPENSIQAILNCIEMGVDIVEIDIRKTIDNQLVVIHDRTLDRTTTGSGRVEDHTLSELKELYLRNGLGIPTEHRIPTLEEVMLLIKGKILINLDKSYDVFQQVHAVLHKTKTIDHVIMKSKFPKSKVKSDYGKLMNTVSYMPVIYLEDSLSYNMVASFQGQVDAMEFVFPDAKNLESFNLSELKKSGSRLWINTLWGSLCGNHHDDLAIYDLENSYGWVVGQGFNIIQTDRPQLLLSYLRQRGLHN